MNRHHALRFLLLKHLWMLRAHVPAERHRRIAQSLKVEKNADVWVVTWRDGDEPKTLEFPLDDVALYVRGDLGGKVAGGSDAKNEVLGERFARQALAIADHLGRQAKVGRFERLGLQIAGCVVVVAAMVATASWPALAAVALAATMTLPEFWFRKGKTLNAIFGLILAGTGAPAAALIANTGLAGLNFADPDRKWRAYRIAAHLAAAGWSVVALLRHPAPAVAIVYVVAAFVAAFAIAYFRWLNGSHFRLYPLVFPLVCAGLVWNGEWLPGAIGLFGSAAGFLLPFLFASNVTMKGTEPALLKRLGPLSIDPELP
ncbi:hypothetical protein UP10_18690 [Bradyrhizobium sp. LTSPM299]|uniref:hypothetical protein n=1 Tax=Bradyrhizobium sp. LTSPM299 TaxID=1619233 RepID=UPI0005CAEF35|nr:hypothetical protein [Bradyrhizobium sp. LTSPM299]KJC59514.1 hypothetical protein UP10_18690 [Bradyrhizobium sp. LTSPM299]